MVVMGWMARAEDIEVRAHLDAGADAGIPFVSLAKGQAQRVMAQAGVRLRWVNATPGVMEIRMRRREPLPGEALARAFVFQGTKIDVDLDRILCHDRPMTVLAYVIAHEITHLLQGCNRHSRTGIMKAQWDNDDYAAMAYKGLSFEPGDLQLIQAGFKGADRKEITLAGKRK